MDRGSIPWLPQDEKKDQNLIDLLHEISLILDTDLDRETIELSVELLESGVNYEALTNAIKEVKEKSSYMQDVSGSSPIS
ncbi:mitotic-spindle organizing gamma-tubulin ring associated-domain-containing protein [Dipodascopsis uninucleata]